MTVRRQQEREARAASGTMRTARPVRGGKGAAAYVAQLRRLGASEREVTAAEAATSRSRTA